jgi:hypothetical protein
MNRLHSTVLLKLCIQPANPSIILKTAVGSIHPYCSSRLEAFESRCFVSGHDFSRAAKDCKQRLALEHLLK